MQSRFILTCLALGLAFTFGLRPATAHDPALVQVAEHCVEEMAQITAHCVQRNAVNTAACVQRIEHLLEAGHVGAAFETGQRCAVRITQRTSVCSARLELLCGQCTLFLVSHGAPGLAQVVQNACLQAVTAVQNSRDAALNAIQDALPDA